MPRDNGENQSTETGNNFTQGQSSQQESSPALSEVCRLYEQSQQQPHEMMNQLMNMGNQRGPHPQHSRLAELQKTRPLTFHIQTDQWKQTIGFVTVKER